jgi:glucosamine--fructose-6-phosphate aminotransferase (isomerizing)
MHVPTPFEAEIAEQPAALLRTLESLLADTSPLQQMVGIVRRNSINRVVIIGMGSSCFSGEILRHYLLARGLSAEIWDAGEALYGLLPALPLPHTALLLVSQSGESGEIIQLLNRCEERGWPKELIWAITNSAGSTLARRAGCALITPAGPETSVTSKTYTTALLVQYALAKVVAGAMGRVVPEAAAESQIGHELETEVFTLADQMTDWLQAGNQMLAIAAALNDAPFLLHLARGPSVSSALQGALNTKEVLKVPAEAITLGMFRHGPIEAITSGTRAIAYLGSESVTRSAQEILAGIAETWGGGRVVVITPRPDLVPDHANITVVRNPCHDPYLAPIFEALVMQTILCDLARRRGIEPGLFKYSTKITRSF